MRRIFEKTRAPVRPNYFTLLTPLIVICAVMAEPVYAQNPYKPLPDLIVMNIEAPVEAHPGDDLGGQIIVTILNQGTGGTEGGYTLDFVMSADRKVLNQIPTYSPNYRDDVLIEGGRITNMPALGSEQTYTFTQMSLPIPHDVPIGTYFVCAFVDSHNIIKEENREELFGITKNSLCTPMHILAGPSTGPRPGQDPQPARRFDADRDCRYSDREFFAAADEWMSGRLQDAHFFEILDAWIARASLFAQSPAAGPVIEQDRGRLVVRAAANAAREISATIYDANGRVLYTQRSERGRLVWDLRDSKGLPVARGLYLVKITFTTALGTASQLKLIALNNSR